MDANLMFDILPSALGADTAQNGAAARAAPEADEEQTL